MPPKVKGLLFFTTTLACCTPTVFAQQAANSQIALNNAANPAMTAAAPATVTTQDKLAKARAMIAARQLPAAAFELEKLKKDFGADDALQSVVRTMLVGVYLEQPNYERAKELLEETFNRGKARGGKTENLYLPVAGQVIKSAYAQVERYKKLGFSLSDTTLPAEAVADLDRWRKLLEMICEQAKQMGLDEKRHAESFAVLEQAAEARGALARDEYEAAAWRNTMNDTREMIANAQSKVTDVDGAIVDTKNVATVNLPAAPANLSGANLASAAIVTPANNQQNALQIQPVANQQTANAPVQNNAASTNQNNSAPKVESAVAANNNPQQTTQKAVLPKDETATVVKADYKPENKDQMVRMASLVEMATRKVSPNYPLMARTARVGGVVKVEVVINEQGEVAEVKTTEGPELLRRAAVDAVRRWKFKPATRDGQAVKMSGFVNFNFAL